MKKQLYFSLIVLVCFILAGCGGEPSAGGSPVPPGAPATAAPAAPTTPATPAATLVRAVTPAPAATAVSIPTPAATLEPAAGGTGDSAQIILNSLRALIHVKAYRLSQTILSEQTSITQTAEIIPPARMHMTTIIAGLTAPIETIIISPTMYTHARDGAWVAHPASDLAGLLQYNSDEGITEIYGKNISNARQIGTDTVAGKPARVYGYMLTLADYNTIATEKLWIGSADGLPYRKESDSSVTTDGKTVSAKTTAIYSDFNSDLQITAPTTTAPAAGATP